MIRDTRIIITPDRQINRNELIYTYEEGFACRFYGLMWSAREYFIFFPNEAQQSLMGEVFFGPLYKGEVDLKQILSPKAEFAMFRGRYLATFVPGG